MLLTNIAVAGMLGAGVKVYRDKKRKREMPWTVMAERMGLNGLIKSPRHKKPTLPFDRFRVRKHLPKGNTFVVIFRESAQKAMEPFKALSIGVISSDAREKQLKQLSATGKIEVSDIEKKNNRFFAIALSSLVFTSAGHLFYAPLSWLSLPGLLYLTSRIFDRTRYYIFEQGRVGVAIVDWISLCGSLATWHLFASSLQSSIFFFNRRLWIKTEDHTNQNLFNVFGEQPRFVWILVDEVEVEVPFDDLKKHDIVVVGAGQMIPVDGTIISGAATIDQRMFTGESQPVEKAEGEEVFASTVILSGNLSVQVEKAGAETLAAQVGDVLHQTADFKRTIESRGEAVITKWSWVTLGFSGLALLLLGPTPAVAVSCVGFGYQMRAAAPLSVLNYFHISSKSGILIKDGRALELLAKVDTVVFDKTGTLTEGVPHVGKLYTCVAMSEDDLLTYAAACEQKQSHPIALSILQEAEERGLSLPKVDQSQVEVGYGLKVRIDGHSIKIGSTRFMKMEEIAIPVHIRKIQQACHEEGYLLVYVAIDGQLAGAIELHPTIRPEAKQIIAELRERNLSLYIISGDHETPTRKLAAELGIDHYFAETLPENKADLITGLQQDGKSVCFVGDGINDSIALKKANVSISLSGASTIATDTAGIVLMDGSLKQLNYLFSLADELDRNLNTSYWLSLLPGFVCVGGVFFLHWSIVTAILLYNAALVGSLGNAMLPLLRHAKVVASQPASDATSDEQLK